MNALLSDKTSISLVKLLLLALRNLLANY